MNKEAFTDTTTFMQALSTLLRNNDEIGDYVGDRDFQADGSVEITLGFWNASGVFNRVKMTITPED